MNAGIEAIKARISVRTYDPAPLAPEVLAALGAAMAGVGPGPFGHLPRFALSSDAGEGKGGRIGSYGVIRGATAFIVGVVEPGRFACVDYGYRLEELVLQATGLGLGSCWIGGLFDRALVKRVLGARPGEFCPAMTPVGYPASAPGLQDRLIRASARAGDGVTARVRKERSELFFGEGDDGSWLPLGKAGPLDSLLEAVRIGPSASNKQPWRILVPGKAPALSLHLFMEEDRLYNNMLGQVKLQELDMGIAMCHVDAAAAGSGLSGSWHRLGKAPAGPDGRRRYIATWTVEGG